MDDDLRVYLNGEIVPAAEATVPVFDHSFLYGDGVFEGIRVYDDRVFKLDEHLDRLYDSAKMLKLDVGLDREEMKEAVADTLRANPETVTYLRPVVSRGTGPVGIAYTDEITEPTVAIIPQIREAKYTGRRGQGLDLITLSTRRTAFEHLESRIKSNNYINNVLGKLEVFDADADDGLMLDRDGYVAEACAGNPFCVHGDAVLTPPRANVLDGITRRTVLGLAADAGYETREEPLTPYDFVTADEAFITSTMTEIEHIASLDGRQVGDGELGPVTGELIDAYRELTRTEGFRWR